MGPPKEASLYFDAVFPFDMNDSMLKASGLIRGDIDPNAIPFDGEKWDESVISSLLRSPKAASIYKSYALLASTIMLLHRITQNPEIFDAFGVQEKAMLDQILIASGSNLDTALVKSEDGKLTFNRRPFVEMMTNSITETGFLNSASWRTGWAAKEDEMSVKNDNSERYVTTLKGLDLIDASQIPWEMIVELRNDKDAMNELRNFRLFFTDTFNTEDQSYIEDKIVSLHDRHKETAKIWGMKTTNRSLSALIDKNTLTGATAVGAGLGFLGGPLAAAAALAIPIGKACLEIRKVRIEAREATLDRPLQYLSRLEELGERF